MIYSSFSLTQPNILEITQIFYSNYKVNYKINKQPLRLCPSWRPLLSTLLFVHLYIYRLSNQLSLTIKQYIQCKIYGPVVVLYVVPTLWPDKYVSYICPLVC